MLEFHYFLKSCFFFLTWAENIFKSTENCNNFFIFTNKLPINNHSHFFSKNRIFFKLVLPYDFERKKTQIFSVFCIFLNPPNLSICLLFLPATPHSVGTRFSRCCGVQETGGELEKENYMLSGTMRSKQSLFSHLRS